MLLIHNGSGGVGQAAIQIARAAGVRVLATASETNHEFLSSLGAEPLVYGEGLIERVRVLAPDGVDAVFYYVSDDRVIEPKRIYDEDELLALWRTATNPG